MVSTSSTRGPGGHFGGWKLKLAAILVILVLLFLGGAFLLNAFNYSTGTRTGVIDKLSTKGFVCWTMEGQLALPNFSKSGSLRPGNDTLDNTFYFSVPDKEVQKEIEAIPPGSPVTLEYHQKLFALDLPIPFLCLRRTEYEIVGVKAAPAYPQNAPVPMRP